MAERPIKPVFEPEEPQGNPWQVAEVAALILLCFVLAGVPAPDINEAHYLAKAKHYWNPTWCAGDLLLESADAHLVFYWIFGWLTLFLPLPAVAWIGRFLAWTLLAVGWQRLSWAVVPRPWLSLLTAALWIELARQGHLAGEWVVGGIEGKSLAYGFVLLALEAAVTGVWSRVWPLVGLAASFHVLVGGWAGVALASAWIAAGEERPSLLSQLPWLALGIGLALGGVVPALVLTWGVDAGELARANFLYVYTRLPHHLDFESMALENKLRLGGLAALWLAGTFVVPAETASQRVARGFVVGTMLIAVVGIGVSLLAHVNEPLAVALMRYYWFRLADVIVPMGISLMAGVAIDRSLRAASERTPYVVAALIVAVAFLAGGDAWRQREIDEPPTDLDGDLTNIDDWQAAGAWVKTNTPADALFLTPRNQMTFKWHAGRAEVATWKDLPQDARSINTWWRRLNALYGYDEAKQQRKDPRMSVGQLDNAQLSSFRRDYKAPFDYIVLDRRYGPPQFKLPRVYPQGEEINGSYAVYRWTE